MHRDELTRWVGDTDRFLDHHWRTEPAIFRPGPDAGPDAPLTLEEIDAALAGGLLRVPHLEIARAGDPVHSSRYTRARTVAGVTTPGYADPERVRALLAEGATLVLRNVEHWHPATRALTRRLEGELGRRVEAFFFVTPPGAQGLDLHRDDADVLLLQGTGSKHWTVRGGPAGPDWAPGAVADAGPALLSDTLRPGETLYIPRGFAHEAVGGEGLSSHLSLTIREVASQQLFRSLQHLLLDSMPLPPRPLDDEALHGAAELLLERFRRRLPELTPAALLEHARAAQLAEGAVPGLGTNPGLATLATHLAPRPASAKDAPPAPAQPAPAPDPRFAAGAAATPPPAPGARPAAPEAPEAGTPPHPERRVTAAPAVLGAAPADRRPPPEPPSPSGLRLLLTHHLRPHRRRLAAGAALALLGGLAGLAEPMAAKALIDRLVDGGSPTASAIGLAALVLTSVLVTAAGSYLLERTAEGVVRTTRERLAARVLRLPVADMDRQRPGDLVARLTSDTTQLRAAAGQALAACATSTLMVIGGLAAMFLLDPLLAGATVGVIGTVCGLGSLTLPRIGRAARLSQEVTGELGATLERSLGAFRTVKANGLERQETAAAREAAHRAWHSGVRAVGWEAAAEVTSGVSVRLAFLTVLGFGGARVATGAMTMPELVAFLFYVLFVGPLLTQLAGSAGLVQRGAAAARRIHEIESLAVEPVADRAPEPPPAGRTAPVAVAFQGVSFGYPGRADPVLDSLSLDVPAGGLTALVGPSGAGKSTAFALLERFYEPDAGRILLDGRDVRDWPLTDLRATIGYVEQDAPVLSGTLRANLLQAAPWASPEELRTVLEVTRLDGTAGRLPQGLDTELGHRGTALSGGQRQRVAIARALLRRPRLLLLDEATSQLDAENERALRDAVADIARTTTVVVIAHRLSTVTGARKTVVLEAGRARATGTHRELLASDALYARLVRTQLIDAPAGPR